LDPAPRADYLTADTLSHLSFHATPGHAASPVAHPALL